MFELILNQGCGWCHSFISDRNCYGDFLQSKVFFTNDGELQIFTTRCYTYDPIRVAISQKWRDRDGEIKVILCTKQFTNAIYF